MRILVVEDEHKIANAIKRGLEQEQYAVDVVYDGKEALGFALTEPYDVMILDRMLPNILDGLEICQKVREKGIHTPILMLTAKDQLQDRVSGLNTGADDYLVKPFAFEELLARVRALLRRPKEALESILTVEGLTLDTINYSVKRNGKNITLSSKEFSLLEYLMRNVGRILTKESIISHVWDYDADVLPNTVEVYIGYLRTKIDKPFKTPALIHTVRGFGYKLGKE
jgi:DNA-binding response OmpR family regulator